MRKGMPSHFNIDSDVLKVQVHHPSFLETKKMPPKSHKAKSKQATATATRSTSNLKQHSQHCMPNAVEFILSPSYATYRSPQPTATTTKASNNILHRPPSNIPLPSTSLIIECTDVEAEE